MQTVTVPEFAFRKLIQAAESVVAAEERDATTPKSVAAAIWELDKAAADAKQRAAGQ